MQRTFEFKLEGNRKENEDVGADVKENYVRYHVKSDDRDVTVIEDFNRVSKLNNVDSENLRSITSFKRLIKGSDLSAFLHYFK